MALAPHAAPQIPTPNPHPNQTTHTPYPIHMLLLGVYDCLIYKPVAVL